MLVKVVFGLSGAAVPALKHALRYGHNFKPYTLPSMEPNKLPPIRV
jgi:hypothetical protein